MSRPFLPAAQALVSDPGKRQSMSIAGVSSNHMRSWLPSFN